MDVNFIFNYSVIKCLSSQKKTRKKKKRNGWVGRQNFLLLFFDWREKSQPSTQMSVDKSVEEK